MDIATFSKELYFFCIGLEIGPRPLETEPRHGIQGELLGDSRS